MTVLCLIPWIAALHWLMLLQLFAVHACINLTGLLLEGRKQTIFVKLTSGLLSNP